MTKTQVKLEVNSVYLLYEQCIPYRGIGRCLTYDASLKAFSHLMRIGFIIAAFVAAIVDAYGFNLNWIESTLFLFTLHHSLNELHPYVLMVLHHV